MAREPQVADHWCSGIVGEIFALYMANLGSISGTQYGPLSTVRVIVECRVKR